jgi:methylenetetrahydrofolate--tRNA-(uracil-5-)-methyltransferase
MKFNVIGAGLAGTEAAWQIANAGEKVTLFEQKPLKRSPAHKTDDFAELVCSNSLKAARIDSAAGLLKEEMARLGSLTVPVARECSVAAGGALAVDRNIFSSCVTEKIRSHPNITVVNSAVEDEATSEKCPSKSTIEAAPLERSCTAAPIAGLPSLSRTVPLTSNPFCAKAIIAENKNSQTQRNLKNGFFIVVIC